jgi:GH24 family phage-related lysozyme (muramidase)
MAFDCDVVKERITHYESRHPKAYIDTHGHPRVGIRFDLDRSDAKARIEALGLEYEAVRSGQRALTQDQIDQLFDADINSAVDHARSVVPGFSGLDAAGQYVVVDMIFNLGSAAFDQFSTTLPELDAGAWQQAPGDGAQAVQEAPTMRWRFRRFGGS